PELGGIVSTDQIRAPPLPSRKRYPPARVIRFPARAPRGHGLKVSTVLADDPLLLLSRTILISSPRLRSSPPGIPPSLWRGCTQRRLFLLRINGKTGVARRRTVDPPLDIRNLQLE